MQKENKKQTNRKKSIIILITVMALIGIIIGSIVIRNVVVNQKTEGESYLAGENAGSSLMASYIRKGVTIGGITGTLESLDTSDATAKPEDILEGKTAYVNGVKITGTMKEKVNMGDITGEEKENTETQDSLGNKVVVPAGFKVVNPHDNVEKGIIIGDVSAGDNNTKGSQFVWIPVGKIKTSEGEKEITLGRYTFDINGNRTLIQSAENYADETVYDSPSSYDSYQELLNTTTSKNTKAKDIERFATKTLENEGYYIGRYEAGDAIATSKKRDDTSSDNNPIVCKTGIYPYTYITQQKAANLCQNMYSDNNFVSDLINSYAWDTAIVFILECSGDTTYFRRSSSQDKLIKCGEATNKDVKCNIFDMAENTSEWSTEANTYSYDGIVYRGSHYGSSAYQTQTRSMGNYDILDDKKVAFRPILYL